MRIQKRDGRTHAFLDPHAAPPSARSRPSGGTSRPGPRRRDRRGRRRRRGRARARSGRARGRRSTGTPPDARRVRRVTQRPEGSGVR
ncbi:hypothetical protein BRD16_09575 [Halobacteriales archaeon SW_6_65_46]|nr:MAG: hypothetical protein BRD16_09575 [Halobacteriales archaeon SW_6_65_46]